MQTSSSGAFAEASSAINFNNGEWIIVLCLIAIIIALIIAWIIVDFKKEKKIDTLQRNAKTSLSQQELNMLENYRKLNSAEKTNIDNLISAIKKKNTP